MSITKERLEKLVKQCATVYETSTRYGKVLEIPPATGQAYLNFLNGITKASEDIYNINNLYETKDEAEHYVKYCGMPSNEVLNLPTWEDRQSKLFYVSEDFCKLIVFTGTVGVFKNDKLLFSDKMTKENYYKALDLCVKI